MLRRAAAGLLTQIKPGGRRRARVNGMSPISLAGLGRRIEQRLRQRLQARCAMRDNLSHYLPAQVAQTLLANGGRLEPVEAKATILMCDIEGFAALTDSIGPRHVFDFLNAYFELLVEIVERHR